MVNGMHIYGWPISAKVADYGWNNRRKTVDRRHIPDRHANLNVPGSFGIDKNKYIRSGYREYRDARKDVQGSLNDQDNRSFAEAVRNNRTENMVTRGVRSVPTPTMSWFGSSMNEKWLVGEVVCVDKETNNRARLDKARILIVVPYEGKIVSEVVVNGGNREFTISIKEDPSQISIEWVNNFLGLNPSGVIADDTGSKHAVFSNGRDEEEKDMSECDRAQDGKSVESREDAVKIRKKAISNTLQKQNIQSAGKGVEKRQVSTDKLPTTSLAVVHSKVLGGDKGKGTKVYKMLPKSLWFPMCKSGVRIGVERRGKKTQVSEEESSSSGLGFMFGKGPNYYVGEQSKLVDSPKIVSVDSDGSSKSTNNRCSTKRTDRPYVIENEIALLSNRNQSNEQAQVQGSLEDFESYVAETQVASQGKILDQGISLCIDLRGHELGKAGCNMSNEGCTDLEVQSTAARSKSCRVKKKRGKGFEAGVQSHSMKTRRSKIPHHVGTKSRARKVIWNLDEEITKVYEKGAEMGVDFKARTEKHSDKKSGWVLEEEVRKVIDTGVALGIDFNGREAEVMLYLSAREQEDEDNFNE
ncbi:hypothetical protein Q3G72_031730 [Acer saccharum]|nr:hypothetical protein Q3G72_031730 [Acer saccharum]